MVTLYFVRHGDASHRAPSDHERPLTKTGQREVGDMVRALIAARTDLDVVFSSPRLRAQQTAEIIAGALGVPLEIRDACNFDFDFSAARALVSEPYVSESAMFVGHNPSMSQTVYQACGANLSMKTGAIACIAMDDVRPGAGQLLWYTPPKLFKRLRPLETNEGPSE